MQKVEIFCIQKHSLREINNRRDHWTTEEEVVNFIVLLDLVPCKKNFRIIGKKERDVEKISMKKEKRWC